MPYFKYIIMRKIQTIAAVIILAVVFVVAGSFRSENVVQQDALTGAWTSQGGTGTQTWIFTDGYAVMSIYDKAGKKFLMTAGGPYRVENNNLNVSLEFETRDSTKVGTAMNFPMKLENDVLTLTTPGGPAQFKRVDKGNGALAGNWRISGRLQDGKIVESRPGPRKTLKILSGTRFQWIAINPEVKGFYGTGGGTYTFENGKYTEHIEFFSRDSSRVGASLTFDGKVEDGAWHHSGLSSRGEPLNEIWKRVK